MKLRVTYERPQDVVTDHEQQFARGGLLVRVDPPLDLEQRSAIELELVTPHGVVVLAGEALQVFPRVGIAVGFDPASAELRAVVDAARSAASSGETSGAAPVHSIAPESKSPAEPEVIEDALTRVRKASTAEKMRIARQGNREERGVIIRDPTAKHLHQFVVRNPHVQLDEISQIARMTTSSADVYAYIASQPDWAQRPEVALALARNPKVAISLAINMLNYVSVADLRQIAKAGNVRDPIKRAALKKLT